MNNNLAPAGFFEFSLAMGRRSDLDHWRGWFKIKKIKTRIVTDSKGKFILCREGEDAHR